MKKISFIIMLCALVSVCGGCSNESEKKSEVVSESTPVQEVNEKDSSKKTPAEVKSETDAEKTANESVQNQDWKTIYAELINSNKEIFNDYGYLEVGYVGVNDINFDGVPELIVSDNCASAANTVGIFYIEDGEAKLLCGFSQIAENEKEINNNIDFYANFEDDWFTLRKNVKTGELKYVMNTGNGSDGEEFGNIVSFCADENGGFKITNEFEYELIYDIDDDYKLSEANFVVMDKKVTEEEYNKAKDEFEKLWIDTGVRTCAMTQEWNTYSNKIPISLEKADLQKLFDSYQTEY